MIGGEAAAVESVFACMHASAVGGSVGFDRFGVGVDCVLCEAVGAKEWREGGVVTVRVPESVPRLGLGGVEW